MRKNIFLHHTVLLVIFAWCIAIVYCTEGKDFQEKLAQTISSIADQASKDEQKRTEKLGHELTPHRDLYAIFSIDHVSSTVHHEAKQFTSKTGDFPPDTMITTDHMLIESRSVDCLLNTKISFPDHKTHHLLPPWSKQSDTVEISLPCPRILKEPPEARSRRSVQEELEQEKSDLTITLSNWMTHDDDESDQADPNSEGEYYRNLEELRRSRRSVNASCGASNCTPSNPPVHGGYGAWKPFSSCSKTCGGGTQTRVRFCDSPAPANGGNNCSGQSSETQACNTEQCIECGGYLSGSGGNFTSPLYGKQSTYPSNMDCVWNISAPADHYIVVEFDDFHLEQDKKCYYDYVEFYDGTLEESRVIDRYCGQAAIYPVNSTDRKMTVKFKSDKDVEKSGFSARWYPVRRAYPSELDKYKPQRVSLVSSVYSPWRAGVKHQVPFGVAYSCPSSVSSSYQCQFNDAHIVISRIITVALNRTLDYQKKPPTLVTFQHILSSEVFPRAYNMKKACVFWDPDIPGTSWGAWSRLKGSVVSSNLTHTTCKFYTSGSFALLGIMDNQPRKLHLFANTYVGMSLGIIGCLLTLASLHAKTVCHLGEKMSMYQAISICFVLIMYIMGAHMPADKHFCGFLAFGMYYFVLATFFWLLLSIIRIHGRFTSMFSSQVKIEIVHFIIGWGIPLLLAGIAGGIEIDKERQHDVCWTAARGGNIWSYAAPVFILIAVSTGFLGRLGIPTRDILEMYRYDQMRVRIGKTGLLLLMYLLSWITGLLVIAHEDFTSQYFFCMFLVLLAILLFVFAREEVDDFKRVFKKDEVKDDSIMANDEFVEEKEGIELMPDNTPQQPTKKRRKRKDEGPSEKLTVPTLKNLNIYKENGVFVIEA